MVTKIQLDLKAVSGSQPFAVEPPGKGVDPNPAFLALAASSTGLDRRLVNPSAQAVAMLASWAAGAMVKLTDEQLVALVASAKDYKKGLESKGQEFKGNAGFVDLVIEECRERACRMTAQRQQVGVVEGECAPVDFGLWTNVPNLTESFVAQCVRLLMMQQGRSSDASVLAKSPQLLNTLFFVFTNHNTAHMTKSAQATALLALYGAGASVTLTQEQYKQLDDEVAEYARALDPDDLAEEQEDRPSRVRYHFLVSFIRKLATDRATQDGMRYDVIVPPPSLKALGLF